MSFPETDKSNCTVCLSTEHERAAMLVPSTRVDSVVFGLRVNVFLIRMYNLTYAILQHAVL